jgi:hypothetical protein
MEKFIGKNCYNFIWRIRCQIFSEKNPRIKLKIYFVLGIENQRIKKIGGTLHTKNP